MHLIKWSSPSFSLKFGEKMKWRNFLPFRGKQTSNSEGVIALMLRSCVESHTMSWCSWCIKCQFLVFSCILLPQAHSLPCQSLAQTQNKISRFWTSKTRVELAHKSSRNLRKWSVIYTTCISRIQKVADRMCVEMVTINMGTHVFKLAQFSIEYGRYNNENLEICKLEMVKHE